ncbi:phosphoheptose isomerase [Bacteroidetes bacterium UKL13-3]|nr:phosphoheptose isomerase [Bacteroidetes bacterium UKL13-3]HCP93952.1 phosphoheptose isomerase [Bacteroidota bacterium]
MSFDNILNTITKNGLSVTVIDSNRPWGGFFVIEESQAQLFANQYFEGLDVSTLAISGKLSPKLLVVAPGKRLSWQYHNRRAEIWRVVKGEASIVRSNSNEEGPLEILTEGSVVTLKQGERHRLIGLTDWAVIAEIWQHTDALNPSDEEDIIRLQDDFGR